MPLYNTPDIIKDMVDYCVKKEFFEDETEGEERDYTSMIYKFVDDSVYEHIRKYFFYRDDDSYYEPSEIALIKFIQEDPNSYDTFIEYQTQTDNLIYIRTRLYKIALISVLIEVGRDVLRSLNISKLQ